MIECDECNYDNNPPEELNCLYCKAKLHTVQVLIKSKDHFKTLDVALDWLEKYPESKIGEITVTDQNHMLYTDINNIDVILRINPLKFHKEYYHEGWFSIANSVPSRYRVRDVAQTRKDIILVFLKRLD